MICNTSVTLYWHQINTVVKIVGNTRRSVIRNGLHTCFPQSYMCFVFCCISHSTYNVNIVYFYTRNSCARQCVFTSEHLGSSSFQGTPVVLRPPDICNFFIVQTIFRYVLLQIFQPMIIIRYLSYLSGRHLTSMFSSHLIFGIFLWK